jgi:hypothetical protein
VQEDTETHNFTKWIAEAGGSMEAIRIGRLPSGNRAGRGVLATRAIAEGEVVARVPLSLLINIEHVLVDPVLGPLLDENGGAAGIVHAWLGDVDALAVFLCHERRKHGREGRALSHWHPWISLLPPLDQNASVLTYAEDLLTELQASPLLTVLRDGRRRLTEVHGRLLKLKGFRGRPPRGAFRKYLREEHAWGLLLVMSRAHKVRVKDSDGVWHDTSCLVPLADFFNTGGCASLALSPLPLILSYKSEKSLRGTARTRSTSTARPTTTPRTYTDRCIASLSLSARLPACLPARPPACLPACLPACPSVRPSDCVSASLRLCGTCMLTGAGTFTAGRPGRSPLAASSWCRTVGARLA